MNLTKGDKVTQKTNYQKLRDIDVSEHTEKKGKFNYLSWAWAVDQLYLNDPDATYQFEETVKYDDGTMMIYCTVTAFGKPKTMWLPVLDHQNKPISNPNAFQINTSMMRCLVKAIAMHGLGLYIYAGEDLPEATKEELSKVAINENQIAILNKLFDERISDKDAFIAHYKIEKIEDLPSAVFLQAKGALEKKPLKVQDDNS